MTKTKRFSIFLPLILILSLFGCTPDAPIVETTVPPPEQTYTLSLHSLGGMPLSAADLYIYADSTLTDLVAYGSTDENGFASFLLPESGSYAITISGLPQGYTPETSYAFTGTAADIRVASAPIPGETLSGAALTTGDVIYDFTVQTSDGESLTLSQMLAEKDMVLINFWYTTCTYCVAEFPFMQEAAREYSGSVGIIALNPFEDAAAINAFKATYGLELPMASCPAAWANTFGVSGYPTSVIVDRYGVICLIEVGGITSLRPFQNLFDRFTGEDYTQTLYASLSELVTNVMPNVSMDSSEAVSTVLDGGQLNADYRPEEGDEYAWPFVITEKNGEACLKASNQEISASYAILYADVSLEEGQAIGFDYLASTEKGCDVLHVIVNNNPVYAISGYNEAEVWETRYAWVAQESDTYEVAFCYLKDSDTDTGDDTVYLKNLRVVDASEIDIPTHIPQSAATELPDGSFEYVDIFYSEADGYYHVGSESGPLLLADLMGYTQWNEEKTLWELVYDGNISMGGYNYYEDMVNWFSYASNSVLSGICPVTQELYDWLTLVDSIGGFDESDPLEWLKLCKFYAAYGTTEQLPDPIRGLADFCAYEAKLGSGNCFYYDRPIMPRGLLAAFTPEKSGVYRITSSSESEHGVEGWIFEAGRSNMFTYAHDERMYEDNLNVSMLYYMEAGKTYYIDIAFWDIYEVGYIYYDIEYVAPSYDVFRTASPGFFTYDVNATGELMYALIAGGIDVVLGEDGYYYEDLGKDEDGNQRYGSLLYCDFTGLTSVFSNPITTIQAYNADGTPMVDAAGNPMYVNGMIDMGGFDFSKTEDDLYILSFLKKFDGDAAATDAYLREYWGEDYDAYAEAYRVEDVYEGIYHGRGPDLTEEMRGYLDQMITTGKKEQYGCVPVDARLAEILQLFMDKYTFSGVEHSWTKLCYYYDHLGPQ